MPWLRQPNDPLAQANQQQRTAMYIAKVVRNAMEDFHVAHLSDDRWPS
jgi:hypothetical protein